MIGRRNFLRSLAATALVGLGMRFPSIGLTCLCGLPKHKDGSTCVEFGGYLIRVARIYPQPVGPTKFEDWLDTLPSETRREIVGDTRTIRIKRWNPTDTPFTPPDLPHEI